MSEQEMNPTEEAAESSVESTPSAPAAPAAARPAQQKSRPNTARPARYDDGEDDDYDDYEDYEDADEEEDDGLDARGRFGVPTDYVPSTQRGRSRRIHIDIKLEDLHYKNIPLLTRFLDTRGRILSRRKTGVSAKVQRRAVAAIKRARHLALLPYTAEHTRVTRLKRRG